VVSTDDEEIYDHAVAKGCLKIGLRPAHLATDAAGKWGVWQHALEASEALIGPVDAFLDLDCTSPLRQPADITAALEIYKIEHPDLVMSCCEARKNPYVVSPAYLKRSKGLWEGRVIPYLMPPERCVDIDTPFDFRLVEFLMQEAANG
jgi:N-acylneuraminate cytidylyltransferase